MSEPRSEKKQPTGPPQDREVARVEAEAVRRQAGVEEQPAPADEDD
jgi:hypothetical protein